MREVRDLILEKFLGGPSIFVIFSDIFGEAGHAWFKTGHVRRTFFCSNV
jgi:hypothetical protein